MFSRRRFSIIQLPEQTKYDGNKLIQITENYIKILVFFFENLTIYQRWMTPTERSPEFTDLFVGRLLDGRNLTARFGVVDAEKYFLK